MMRNALITFLALVLLLSAAGPAYAGVSDAGVLFLRIAAGARAAGMGEAFVAVADDATATHWNPAGLGSYPLTSEFHELKIRDDKVMREMAQKVLKGDVPEGYSETVGQFLFRGDGVVRVTESGEETYLEFAVNPDISIVQFIAANAQLKDRDILKLGVRSIATLNTGVTFTDIDSQRRRLLPSLSDDQAVKVNGLFEKIVADWQNLKIVPESVTFLEEKLNFVLGDNSISTDEYTEVLETLQKTSKDYRPEKLKVPYAVLVALWKDYSLPWEMKIEDITLVENDIPDDSYKRFDLWAVTPEGIIRWNGMDAWDSYFKVYPKKGDFFTDLLSVYSAEGDEDRLKLLKEKVASLNYGTTRSELEGIKTQLTSLFDEANPAPEMLSYDLENLLIWFEDLTLDPDRLSVFLEAFESANADGQITTDEVDRLQFSLHACNAERLPSVVYLPYSLPFTTAPTCIAATEKLLWVGTDDGLFLFNGRAWQKYTIADGIPSNKINALSVFDNNRLWVATGRGVAYYYKGNWSFYASETGLTDDEFTAIYGFSREKAWAAAGTELYFFNGDSWRSDYRYTAVVNDSLTRIVREFTGIHDNVYITEAVAELKELNQLETDFPEPGTELSIPFRLAFRHPITAMAYEKQYGKLWVGTTHGLKIFVDGRFNIFGYKPFTAKRNMNIKEAAGEFLGDPMSRKVDQIATLIKSYNMLSNDVLRAGQTVHVFVNPLGSHIHTIATTGDDFYIGTALGTIKYSGERFSRYYHNNLERDRTLRILIAGSDRWFATPQRVVVYAGAKKEITLMHANYAPELADDLYYEYISYVQHLGDDWGTLGLNATFMSYGAIPRTLEGGSTVVDTFHAFDGAFTVTYGTKVSQGLAVGLSAKIIYSRLSDQGSGAEIGSGTATAFAVDAGILYRTPIPKLTLGAAITNLGPNIAYIDAAQSDPLPRNLGVGLAYDLIRNPYNKLTLLTEVNKRLTDLDDGFSEELREAIQSVGFEYWYGSFIALRAGYKNDDAGSIDYFTVGAGLQYRQLRFDFAYIPSSETVPLANTLRISLTGRL